MQKIIDQFENHPCRNKLKSMLNLPVLPSFLSMNVKRFTTPPIHFQRNKKSTPDFLEVYLPKCNLHL